ncbi:uncharacterized protein LOC108950099 [Ciona intestinalis]
MAQVDNLVSIPRPTDLSIKSCLNQKYETVSYNGNCHGYTGNTSDTKQNSPVALLFDGGTSGATKLENAAARLVVLDSLFSQQNGLVPSIASPASPSFDTSPTLKRGRREGHFNFMTGMKDRREPCKANSPPKPTTPVTPTGRGRGCKRKGGWKFHDLSDECDGLGRRKRAYCNNRLENEILQVYQDRISIKEVTSCGGKHGERLVIIEPTVIQDPDIIKHNTALRLVLDKKKGTYKLQLLPFTIEQGSLSNKPQLIHVVSKMLGDNGEVVCPGINQMRTQGRLGCQVEERSPTEQAMESTRKSWAALSKDAEQDRYRGRWKTNNTFSCSEQSRSCSSSMRSEDGGCNSAVTPTDRLLISLNMELTRNKQTTHAVNKQFTNSTSCMLWHNPAVAGKGKRLLWPEEFKWCVNCVRKTNNFETVRNAELITE